MPSYVLSLRLTSSLNRETRQNEKCGSFTFPLIRFVASYLGLLCLGLAALHQHTVLTRLNISAFYVIQKSSSRFHSVQVNYTDTMSSSLGDCKTPSATASTSK